MGFSRGCGSFSWDLSILPTARPIAESILLMAHPAGAKVAHIAIVIDAGITTVQDGMDEKRHTKLQGPDFPQGLGWV